jgi:hypothetical protein
MGKYSTEKSIETMHLVRVLLTGYWTWNILFFEGKHVDELEYHYK